MNRRKLITSTAAPISLLLLLGLGCENKQAVQTLEELTNKMSEEFSAGSESLTKATSELDACMSELSQVNKQASSSPTESAGIEMPTMGEKKDQSTLEAFKTQLSKALEDQKANLAQVRSKIEQCSTDLASAKSDMKARANAAAAAAKRKAEQATQASKETVESEKPTAVKKAEEAGTATKGVRSRYKKR